MGHVFCVCSTPHQSDQVLSSLQLLCWLSVSCVVGVSLLSLIVNRGVSHWTADTFPGVCTTRPPPGTPAHERGFADDFLCGADLTGACLFTLLLVLLVLILLLLEQLVYLDFLRCRKLGSMSSALRFYFCCCRRRFRARRREYE